VGRPITLVTGQWTDLSLETLSQKAAKWGYDGLELACWGGHFDVGQGASSKAYCEQHKALLGQYGLKVWAISNHLAGQMVLDPNDHRSDDWAPAELRGKPEEKSAWAAEEMKRTAIAARNMGVSVVNGFTGSSIWHLFYPFPPLDADDIKKGYDLFAERWGPILDVFQDNGIKFALEVHPTEIAFDIYSTHMALTAAARIGGLCSPCPHYHFGRWMRVSGRGTPHRVSARPAHGTGYPGVHSATTSCCFL
jgi:sugar phosphate isomerase/epimerase